MVSEIQYPAGNVTITITGLRAAIPSLTGGAGSFVSATVASTGVQVVNGTFVLLAIPATSMLASYVNDGIPCSGSAAPVTMDFPGLLAAGTVSSAVRVTEAWPNAFQSKDPTADTGVRIIVNITGYGSNTRIFVPNAIVGNDGSTPTSSGLFGVGFSAGSYAPGQLLLSLVSGADATGAGGNLVEVPGGAATFSLVTEVTGSSRVVYEVVDDNPNRLEYAQIPVFVSAPQSACAASAQENLAPMLAPVSNVSVATLTDPIPRFIATIPGSDCQQLGDCNAIYFPVLEALPASFTLTGSSLGTTQTSLLSVINQGAGQLAFTVSVSYPSGQTATNWLTVSPSSGAANAQLSVVVNPVSLAPGQYLATIAIAAGSAGTVSVPVTFNVGPVGALIQSIVNSATLAAGPVAPGSYATIFGQNLGGTNVQVVLNGYSATVVYDGAGQINILVPSQIPPSTPVGMYVTVNGVVSNTFRTTLAANAPGIFTPGIENQDNSVNLATQPASPGDIAQIYFTGLPIPLSGSVTVNIGTVTNLTPIYAGQAPTIPGLDQVNVQVPVSLTFSGNSAPIAVCIAAPGGQQTCSPTVNLYLK
jgi:uncharacterized protein (TIGR03437 family)